MLATLMRACLSSLLCLAVLPLAATRAADSPTPSSRAAAVQTHVQEDYPRLLELYKHLHSHPELSLQEAQTAARIAREIKKFGFEVMEKVGGHGVVAVLKNGKGPTILVRTDMDALPVVERTDLPYASKVRTRDRQLREVGVMHACGHDVHMTVWTGTAHVLSKLKDHWQGTLVFIAQPAEEIGVGARQMLEDGLYKRFPAPDYALALHCGSDVPHGSVAFTEGLAMANVDSVDIVVKGKGGHGAYPHTTVDPIVIAARIVLDLQTLVSRETNPIDPAVVTVGSIHGGSKHNIIPDEVRLQLTVRSTKDKVRKHLLDGIRRIARAAAAAAGDAPEPEVRIREDEFTPALSNDPALTRKMVKMFRRELGEDHVLERPPSLGGEDFSRYARNGSVPVFMYWLGTIPPDRIKEYRRTGQPLPSLHSDLFAPTPEPALKTGVLTMSLAVLELAGK